VIKEFVQNKSSLILNIFLEFTQAFQLFTKNIKTDKHLQKLLTMPSWKALVERSGNLLKEGWSATA
jgi:hypothetical protein